MKKYFIIIGCLICCCGVFLVYKIYKVDESKYSIPKQIRYSFTLQNKTNQPVNNVKFWAYAPVKLTSTQICKHLESSYPFQTVNDELGNQILQFSFEKFPPFATKIITIKADLLMSEKPNRIPKKDAEQFMRPAQFIESDYPDIIKKANSLSGKNPLKTAENIFAWVSGYITYTGYDKIDRGALYAFDNKKGDCTEYALLFAALCRASKIPTRSILGYICYENNILSPSGFHNWAEFWSGKAWEIADPQNKILMKNNTNYVAMKIDGSKNNDLFSQFDRFHTQGEGITAIMN